MSITSGHGGSGRAAECQTSVDDFGLDLPRRRASADAATGPRLGARGAWLMALGERVGALAIRKEMKIRMTLVSLTGNNYITVNNIILPVDDIVTYIIFAIINNDSRDSHL